MRLRDLLDLDVLRLELLSGTDEQAERALRWVCTTDLLDPGRYLSGGELVISGMLWRRGPEDSEAFVDNITAAGASALAVGNAGEGTDVPADLIEACERHDIPLVWVDNEVAFAQITEQVVAAVTVTREAELRATLGRQRRLLSGFADGRDLPRADPAAQRGDRAGLPGADAVRAARGRGRRAVAGQRPRPGDPDLPDRRAAPRGGGWSWPHAVQRVPGRAVAGPPSLDLVRRRRRDVVAVGPGAGRRGR